MTLHTKKKEHLKRLIDSCVGFEGRCYLIQLYNVLSVSKLSDDLIDDAADKLICLIRNINLFSHKKYHTVSAMNRVLHSYNALVVVTHAGGFFYTLKQVLIDLGGIILGLMGGILGVLVGFTALCLKDIEKGRLSFGMLSGSLAGFLVGATLGYRALNTLFKNSETRAIRHSVRCLDPTFTSLFSKHFKKIKKELQHTLLFKDFEGDIVEFNTFLKGQQSYKILSTRAPFIDNHLKGFLGHHCFIKIVIKKKIRIIEVGNPSDKEKRFSQQELRMTTGEQLINMLAMHKLLQEQYDFNDIRNLPIFIFQYKAGIMDCHTYVDKILLSTGELATNLTRFKKNDTWLGRQVGRALHFFHPLNNHYNKINAPTDFPEESLNDFKI